MTDPADNHGEDSAESHPKFGNEKSAMQSTLMIMLEVFSKFKNLRGVKQEPKFASVIEKVSPAFDELLRILITFDNFFSLLKVPVYPFKVPLCDVFWLINISG